MRWPTAVRDGVRFEFARSTFDAWPELLAAIEAYIPTRQAIERRIADDERRAIERKTARQMRLKVML